MSLKIRLSKNRVVVCETRSKRDGKIVDLLGTLTQIDEKKYQEWLKKGAKPTEIIRKSQK